MSAGVLLDTCVLIYLSTGVKLAGECTEALEEALESVRAHVSLVSAWEIGRAMSLGRVASSLSPLLFYHRFVGQEGVRQCALSAEILIASSYLPGQLHRDPMDRILIATAREHDLTVVTNDRAILAYGAAGHVRTLKC